MFSNEEIKQLINYLLNHYIYENLDANYFCADLDDLCQTISELFKI